MQIGQFLRVHQSIYLLNAHDAQGHTDDYDQVALVPDQDGRATIDLGQRKGQRSLILRACSARNTRTRNGLLAVDRLEVRLRFAATIRPGDGILS